jgi:predicted alpha/beta superfamily hydrolase
MKQFIWVLVICMPSISYCQAGDPVVQFGIRDSLNSKVLHETRPYWVYLPESYNDKSIQPIRYPVLYILDGDIHFRSVSTMMEILGSGVNGSHVIPEMIVVAILNTDRTRDLTPTHSNKGLDGKDWEYLKTSGGGENFLSFVKDELIAKIDSGYRTFPYRIFAGHSFGGIEVIHALLSTPQTFNAYIAIDPSLWWDNEAMATRAKENFKKIDLSGRSLFIAQANTFFADDPRVNMHFEAIKNFTTIAESRSRQTGLKLNYRFYDKDNHGSVAFIAEYDALRFIFDGYYASFGKIKNASDLKMHYQHFSKETRVNFPPPEKVVNEMANVPLFFNKFDVAQEYYQLNLDNYPTSSGAHANMGQLWLNKGDKKKALAYYEKAFQLNPADVNVKGHLENIREDLRAKK